MHDVTFTGHNVLADEELRQGIKDFSNWPTIPQVDKYFTYISQMLTLKSLELTFEARHQRLKQLANYPTGLRLINISAF